MSNNPSRESWQRATRFREHLSTLYVVPEHEQEYQRQETNERSHFSPESTHFSPTVNTNMPETSRSSQAGSFRGSVTTLNHLESGLDSHPRKISLMERLRKIVFDLRTWRTEPSIIPIQEARTEPWPPLHIEKRVCPCQDPRRIKAKKEKKKRRRTLMILLIILLIYLLANSIVLNVKVFTAPSTTSLGQNLTANQGQATQVTTTTQSASSSHQTTSTPPVTLSANEQQCLTQFTVNAPANPSSFPCSTCLPILQSVPSSFIQANQQDGQYIQNGVQFCGLQAIFATANAAGQAVLGNGSWVQNTKFCEWSGVVCDGSGQVSTISLTFPGVPAAIPLEVGALTGLTSFQVIGNGAIPGGSLPSSFTNLTSLTTLHLESTGMTALPDNLFSSLNKMQTLTLVKNNNFGGGLPSTVTKLGSLDSLVINDQTLSTSLSTLLSSTSLQKSLQLLDLTSTSLSTSIPSTISSFTSLVELHLDGNNLQPNPPSAFPSSLQILTLSSNTALSGTLPSELCSSTTLKTCSLQNTALSASNGGKCGVCVF